MKLSLFIARRYLFSPKKQNAINIISAISVAGVAIGTTALIVVLAIFNGMDLLLKKNAGSFTPDLVISPAYGKFVRFDTCIYKALDKLSEIAGYDNVIEEKALAVYGNSQIPVILKGVTPGYIRRTGLAENIVYGEPVLESGDGHRAIVGYGIASQLGLGLDFLNPITFYYPDKNATASVSALRTEQLLPSAFFSSQQDIENTYIITSIDFVKSLFKTDDKISRTEITLTDPSDIDKVKKKIAAELPPQYRIEDKYEINRVFYAMMKSEKLGTFLILLFILLIDSFNIVGSVSMLILDKKEDLLTYKAMGLDDRALISIFKTEGNLITAIGIFLGLIIGLAICLLQQKYGLITLGDGSYIIDAYPVKIVPSDMLIIIGIVSLIGYLASEFPVRYLIKKTAVGRSGPTGSNTCR